MTVIKKNKQEKSKTSSYMIGGIVVTILGAICFSAKAIFVKLAYQAAPTNPISLLALRMVFALPFFISMALISSSRSSNVKFTGKQWIYIAIIGCLGYYISSLLDFMGLQYISASIERLILFIYPTFVILISSFILKEKIKKRQWIALSCTYAGLIIVFMGEASIGTPIDKNFLIGCALIFMCSLTFAVYLTGSSKLILAVGAAKFNSYAMGFAAIGVLLHFFISSGKSLWDLPHSAYVFGFFMAIFSTVIPSYLRTEGIKRIGPENAAIIASIGPVATLWQAHIFLDEPIVALQLVGTALILLGVMLLSWKVRRGLAQPG